MPAVHVSVLIAAYNAAPFLPGALAGLRAQIHQDWELVVVEDGSHDDTRHIVGEFAAGVSQAVRYENLEINRGVAAARNRLLELARGDAVAFLDADDLWRPAHLAALVQCLSAGRALAFSGLELWDAATAASLGFVRPEAAWIAAPRSALFTRSFIQTSSCVALPRATIDRVGRFDETLRIGEDRDYWFRALADAAALGFTGEDTCRYTKHAGSSMSRTLRVAEDTVRFHEKHAAAADIPAPLRRRLLAEARWNYARLLRRTNPAAARRIGWQAWQAEPWRPIRLLWYLAASVPRRPAAL